MIAGQLRMALRHALPNPAGAICRRSLVPLSGRWIPTAVVSLWPVARDNPGEMAGLVASPTFVGRVEELQTLEAGRKRAADADPAVLLVGGEAGIGKTRLVTECAGRCAADGMRVLMGGCVPVGDGALPYAPIVEALRGLLGEIGVAAGRELVGPAWPELARLLPALGEPDRHDPLGESAQARLFELLLGLLGRLGEQAPLVLVLEDLHWADRSTRDLLAFLVRNLRRERLLVVSTYRTDEPSHQRFGPYLAELDRLISVDVPMARHPSVHCNLLLARAERSRLEGASDPERWQEAAATWESLTRPFEAAYARFRQAEALLASGAAREQAETALRPAHHTAVALAAAPLRREIELLAQRGRLRLQEPVDAPTMPKAASLGLTQREAEVLALVAQGRTNRQIGQVLFITPKTASIHVSRILAKLGVTGRGEAAAVAHRLGLDKP